MNLKNPIMLKSEKLEIGYEESNRIIADDINFEVHQGELIALLGPNGSGKSTLIRTVAGLQSKLDGELFIDGRELGSISSGQLAKKVSLVLTDRLMLGNISVYDLIALGRTPYTGMMGKLRPEDHNIIKWALSVTESKVLAQRDIAQLSDGEMQKVMVARALAQTTPMMLLDEPTAHLDLPNRTQILKLLLRLTRQEEKTILLSTHELDLALQIADRLWIINDGIIHKGVPEDMILDGTIASVFGSRDVGFNLKHGRFEMTTESNINFPVKGDEIPVSWTIKALKRSKLSEENLNNIEIEAVERRGEYIWVLRHQNQKKEYHSISEVFGGIKKALQKDHKKSRQETNSSRL